METIIKNQKPNGWINHSNVFSSPFSLLDDVLGGSLFPSVEEDLLARKTFTHMPTVNISEQSDKYSVELSAPGFTKESFKLQILEGNLVISAEKKEEKVSEEKKFSCREFTFGSFRRSFLLSEDADEDKISANYENGILAVTIPKKESEKAKPVREIKVG